MNKEMHAANLKLSILMPVRDEAASIPIVLKKLSAAVETAHEVLIIYDHSEDDSIAAVKSIQPKYPRLRLVYNDLGGGILNALYKGIEAAQGQYILIACVDDIGPVLAIDSMVVLLDQGCDFVSGTRYDHGGRRLGGSRHGAFLSTFANTLFRLGGSVLSDSTTGFKMFKRRCFRELKLESRRVGWVVAFEIGIKAQLAGFKLGEIPILSIDRLYGGKSTFQALPWFIEYSCWFCWGIIQLHAQKHRPQVLVYIPAVTPLK